MTFDACHGIYYRSIGPREQGAGGGVEVIDWNDDGTLQQSEAERAISM